MPETVTGEGGRTSRKHASKQQPSMSPPTAADDGRSQPQCSPAEGSTRKAGKGDTKTKVTGRSICTDDTAVGGDCCALLQTGPVLLKRILSFLICVNGVDNEAVKELMCTSRAIRSAARSLELWENVPFCLPNGSLNWIRFEGVKRKTTGTEGVCFRCLDRATGKELALKKARVYQLGEGVPYYMLRELAVLKNLEHPNISTLRYVSLKDYELRVFFDYIPHALHEYFSAPQAPNIELMIGEQQHDAAIATSSASAPPAVADSSEYSSAQLMDAGSSTHAAPIHSALHPSVALPLMKQLLEAVSCCHRRGILHRNLKPKHLLVRPGDDPNDPLVGAQLVVSDFALVRSAGYPARNYTSEVVTLWYRPPEILMGVRDYTHSVDMWSVGCIFAEMVMGKPLFTGLSEIDQLFQIFKKLGKPTPQTWRAFETLPNYNFAFPKWQCMDLENLFPMLGSSGCDLMKRLFAYDPAVRMTADQALRHPYITGSSIVRTPRTCRRSKHTSTEVAAEDSTQGARVSAATRLIPPHLPPASEAPMRHMYHLLEVERDLGRQESTTVSGTARGSSHPANQGENNTESRNESGEVVGAGGLKASHRCMLVDWIVEVVDVFDICQRTAFLAVRHMDRYLSRTQVTRQEYQLLGATCLHIASKCEDVSYIGIEDLALCADKVYQPQQILDMEEKVLNSLEFQLAIPTAWDFLNLLLELAPSVKSQLDGRLRELAYYLAEISLQEPHTTFEPEALYSKTALACLILALHLLELDTWPRELVLISPHKKNDVKCLVEALSQSHAAAPTAALQVIRKRYLKVERLEVANVPSIPLTPMIWDT